jgi:aminoglycoside phosphotransferase (APT) family kinase protein
MLPRTGSDAIGPYTSSMLAPGDAATIAERFALGPGPALEGPVARGEQGLVYRLATVRGAWAVKEPFDPPAEADVREDAAYQEALRAAGVPLPAVVRTPSGSVFADVGPARVRAYEWVDLRDRDVTIDPEEVGRVLAAIHRCRFEGANPVDAWYTDPIGAARWDELVSASLAAGAPFADALAAFRDEQVALEAFVAPADSLKTCHRDLWADNVRRTAAGSLCVIDWENCGLADPRGELALVLFEFGRSDPVRARRLSAAYVDAGGPSRAGRREDFSMVIAQLGHIAERWCRIWLDPASTDEERARAVSGVDEFLSEPLTRSQVDGLLDAVAR